MCSILPPIHPIGRSHPQGKERFTPRPATTIREVPGRSGGVGGADHKAIHPQLGTLRGLSIACWPRSAREARLGDRDGLGLSMLARSSVRQGAPGVVPSSAGRQRAIRGESAEEIRRHFIRSTSSASHGGSCGRNSKNVLALFWIRRGVRILRVDNPHTKPFPFWRWLIEEIQAEYPDVIFLAEAFTRPKVMYDLAKLGFSQSYTYFALEKYERAANELQHRRSLRKRVF